MYYGYISRILCWVPLIIRTQEGNLPDVTVNSPTPCLVVERDPPKKRFLHWLKVYCSRRVLNPDRFNYSPPFYQRCHTSARLNILDSKGRMYIIGRGHRR